MLTGYQQHKSPPSIFIQLSVTRSASLRLICPFRKAPLNPHIQHRVKIVG